jgi:hypothetical protein
MIISVPVQTAEWNSRSKDGAMLVCPHAPIADGTVEKVQM